MAVVEMTTTVVPVEKPLTQASALKMVREFDCLGFGYPRTDAGVEKLAKSLLELCGTEEKARWLVDRVCRGAEKCPTPIELRRIFCRKYPPADGIGDGEADLSDFLAGGSFRKSG